MAKSKNHTSHTLNYKNHKNGIQKPLKVRLNALKGMDCKYIRNMVCVCTFSHFVSCYDNTTSDYSAFRQEAQQEGCCQEGVNFHPLFKWT